PSEFSSTTGSPASMTAMTELVVPRSIPSTLATSDLQVVGLGRPRAGAEGAERLIHERARLAGLGGVGALEQRGQIAQLPGQLERELHPGEVHSELVNQVLDLAQTGDVLGRVETDVAAGAARLEETRALILAERGRVKLDEAGGYTDDEERFGREHHTPRRYLYGSC